MGDLQHRHYPAHRVTSPFVPKMFTSLPRSTRQKIEQISAGVSKGQQRKAPPRRRRHHHLQKQKGCAPFTRFYSVERHHGLYFEPLSARAWTILYPPPCRQGISGGRFCFKIGTHAESFLETAPGVYQNQVTVPFHCLVVTSWVRKGSFATNVL